MVEGCLHLFIFYTTDHTKWTLPCQHHHLFLQRSGLHPLHLQKQRTYHHLLDLEERWEDTVLQSGLNSIDSSITGVPHIHAHTLHLAFLGNNVIKVSKHMANRLRKELEDHVFNNFAHNYNNPDPSLITIGPTSYYAIYPFEIFTHSPLNQKLCI